MCMKRNSSLWLLSLFIALSACKPNESNLPAGKPETAKVPEVRILTGGGRQIVINVEIAETPAAWERGLMYRQSLDEKAGMFFIFPDNRKRSFWMKNTPLPLDMLFIDEGFHVVGIVKNATPYSLKKCEVDGESRYVLEVNGGFCERYGIQKGDVVEFARQGFSP